MSENKEFSKETQRLVDAYEDETGNQAVLKRKVDERITKLKDVLRNLEKELPCIQELITKSKLTYPCFVVGGYDINNEGPGDYDRESYEDDYTSKGGIQEIKSSTNFLDNPTFELTDLKSSFGVKRNWYKIWCRIERAIAIPA